MLPHHPIEWKTFTSVEDEELLKTKVDNKGEL